MTSDTGVNSSSDGSVVMNNNGSNAVSDAIRAAAATSLPSTTQTRFSFYDAQEVQMKYSENKNDDDSIVDDNGHQRFNLYSASAGSELGKNPVAEGLEGNDTTKVETERDRKHDHGGKERRQELAAVDDNIQPVKVQRGLGSADEILRSLQETEEQRMQILKGGESWTANAPPSAATVKTTTTPRLAKRLTPMAHDGAETTPMSAVGTNQQPSGTPKGASEMLKHQMARPSPLNTLSDESNSQSGSNPYEDAIREALDLLRKHRSPAGTPHDVNNNMFQPQPPTTVTTNGGPRPRTPPDQDRLLQHRGADHVEHDHYYEGEQQNNGEVRPTPTTPAGTEDLTDAYEEAKLKAKQRQERMAKYASRLQEFKSSLPQETMDAWQISNTESNIEANMSEKSDPAHVINLVDHPDALPHTNTADGSVGFSDISQSTKQREDEVQRGVERVLLAILERASASRGRAENAEASAPVPQAHSQFNASSTTYNQSNMSLAIDGESSSVNDGLIQAMEDLLGQGIIAGEDKALAFKNLGSRDIDSVATGLSKKSTAERSVVEDLLAEAEDDDEESDLGMSTLSQQLASPASTGVAMMGQPSMFKEEKKVSDPSEARQRQHTIPEEELVENMIDEVLQDSHDQGDHEDDTINDEIEDDVDKDENDSYDDLDESEARVDSMGRVLGPLSNTAGGTTGVVLDVDQDDIESEEAMGPFSSVMNYVTSALGPKQDGSDEYDAAGNRYATENDDIDIDHDLDDADDGATGEAVELMRTLCAHLLPFGVDQRSRHLLDSIPVWNENDPNEAGYRIIRLSKPQLRRVEYAFENMINGFKAKSQSRLNGLDVAEMNGYDANFVKELQEAERLLDDEEKRLQAVENASKTRLATSTGPTTMSIPSKSLPSPKSQPEKEQVEFPTSQCHPDFPGVKPTGKGEMGDMEFFHLPIIFKSHVTGFEPTKDLVLEPRNVIAGQYLVENELGSAAFSTAYRCIDLSSEGPDGHEEVCLKVIKNTKDFFDQSLDEIKILELLRQTGQCHENHIVEMKTFFYYREHLIIVTELLRQNLFEFGKFITDNNEEPYFTIPRLAYVTRQALISLRFVHNLDLVHSDVKPENILLSSYSRAQIKLIDFGSSCYLTDRQSSYIQSRSYRAPEVVLGLPYNGKIDIWSLGCVVAEMYTGEVTFQNDSIVSMLSRIEAICGPFPRHMIAQGRQSGRFFTKSGLLYELVDDSDREGNRSAPGPHDDDSESDEGVQFDIFQPKTTRLSSRLGFDGDLMDGFTEDMYRTKPKDPTRREQIMFTDFVSKLLTIDPDGRPTAEQALQHPWMQYAAALSDEEIKYPSS